MEIHEIIKELRIAAGLTQAVVAGELSIERTSYVNKERGKTKFSIDEMFATLSLLSTYVPPELYTKLVGPYFASQANISFGATDAQRENLQNKSEVQNGKQTDHSAPVPMDPAIQILNRALEETQVKINEKQKQAVLKILRDELKKTEGSTKEDIKKYLEAFGK